MLGFDTSNYKTSVAVYHPETGVWHSCGKLLEVPLGSLGLRQSDALFQHTRRLPEIVKEACEKAIGDLCAVGYSSQPRAVEGSYMPCFLAGVSAAESIATAAKVPSIACSHQQGHLAAAAFSVGRMDLLDAPFLAWHLSGGTTELLLVQPDADGELRAEIIGGTTDISAGQLIDRTGVMLELPFPAGKHLDALAATSDCRDVFKVKCPGLEFSLSGVQNKVQQYALAHAAADTAAYALRCVCHAVSIATLNAKKAYPGLEVVFSGGVTANSMLRNVMHDAIFCAPAFSTDNAMGVAVLGARLLEG